MSDRNGRDGDPLTVMERHDDDVLAALVELMAALEQTIRRSEEALAKGRRVAEKRAQGLSWTEIALNEERPLVVELVAENWRALSEAGSRLRRAEARALYGDGITMGTIARLFGVTRQRVGFLLRPGGDGAGPEAAGDPQPK
ncbi:MAG: hypothetical protein JWP02_1154 [Acidimicrobiales bacterium]|nr:hypothetical protein [Acidimicrobiales bacterium]